jgi:hypothetical protein
VIEMLRRSKTPRRIFSKQMHKPIAISEINFFGEDMRRYGKTVLTAFMAVAVAFCLSGIAPAQSVRDKDQAPTGKGTGNPAKQVDRYAKGGNGGGHGHKPPPPPPSNGIFYHGGPLILGGTHYYYIWYGNWAGNSATTIVPDFGNSEGGSQYFNINTTYADAAGNHVTNAISLDGQIFDTEYLGQNLGDSQILQIVSDAINNNQLPSDSNGVYFVLTSADVNETSGFCSFYCGWHDHGAVNGADIKYSFVGSPDRCPTACEGQTASSPNGNPGADGMVNIIAHEGEEATTDPDLNAWFDNSGAENADKCAWQFGTEQTAGNGSLYNQTMGGRQYLIQMNWVNASGGYCAQKYP